MRLDDSKNLLDGLAPQRPEGRTDALKDPTEAFEALFVGEIFKAMRATVHEADGNFGQSVFTSMLDGQLAQTIAESGGLGLTEVLGDELGRK